MDPKDLEKALYWSGRLAGHTLKEAHHRGLPKRSKYRVWMCQHAGGELVSAWRLHKLCKRMLKFWLG